MLNHPNCSVPKFEKPITFPNAHVNHVMPIHNNKSGPINSGISRYSE